MDDVLPRHPLRSFSQIAITLSHCCPLYVCVCVCVCVCYAHPQTSLETRSFKTHTKTRCVYDVCECICVCVCVCVLQNQAYHVILLPYVVNDSVMDKIIFMLLPNSTALNLQLVCDLLSRDVEAGMKRTRYL